MRHVNSVSHNSHFCQQWVHTPCTLTHIHTLSLTHRSKHTSQHCSTCHPRNHQRDTADTRGSVRRLVLSGVTVGEKKKMRMMMLKLVLWETVTDDVMPDVTLLCHRDHYIQQSLPPLFLIVSFLSLIFLSPAKISTFLSLLALKLPRLHTGHLAQKMQLSTWVVHLCRDQKEKKNKSQSRKYNFLNHFIVSRDKIILSTYFPLP